MKNLNKTKCKPLPKEQEDLLIHIVHESWHRLYRETTPDMTILQQRNYINKHNESHFIPTIKGILYVLRKKYNINITQRHEEIVSDILLHQPTTTTEIGKRKDMLTSNVTGMITNYLKSYIVKDKQGAKTFLTLEPKFEKEFKAYLDAKAHLIKEHLSHNPQGVE